MIEGAKRYFLPTKKQNELRGLVSENINIFRTSFSSGPSPKVEPPGISLMEDAKPVRVRTRNYSQEKCMFLAYFVALLVTAG